MKRSITTVALVAVLASYSSAAWQRLPSLQERPIELAVGSINGTRIESSKNIGQVSALLSDMVTDAATLSAGSSEVVIDLGRQVILERVSLHNNNGEGKMAVSASADNSRWVPLGQMVFSAADSELAIPFAGIQGKYVKVEFELSRGAVIRNFEVWGGLAGGDNSKVTGTLTNMATSLAGARVIYIDPTPKGGTDNASQYGSFSFPESSDKYRTVIYDLGRPRVLNEFGSVHSPRPVRLEVFAFSELQEKEDWRGRRSFDASSLDSMEPVASVDDREGRGYVKVKPSNAVTARYVALRWEPDFNPPAFVVGGVECAGPAQGLNVVDAKNPKAPLGILPQEVVAGPTPYGVFTGPFAPNSLMGAGSGGLPATSGGSSGPVILSPGEIIRPVSR
jgi:hypothetical protein